jgi:thiol-disulfide isomerase/thioredoxin
MPLRLTKLLLLTMIVVWGCQQGATPPAAGEAEIPEPGPAIEDPGPAPDGQWEPSTVPPQQDAPEAQTPESHPPATDAPATDDEADAIPGEPETSAVQQDTSASADVTLKLQSWDATQELIAAHKGKIVVVDFWATSCLPCRREFPHLVALQKAHPEKVVCVSVSLDYSGRKSRPPESYRNSVLGFLREQQATIDNVLSTDDPDELERRLELAPIPLVWVFDSAGERRRTFDNGDLEGQEFTYEKDVVPFVESLLSES